MLTRYIGQPNAFQPELQHGDLVEVLGSPWRSGGELAVMVQTGTGGRPTTVLVRDLESSAAELIGQQFMALATGA